MDDKERQQRERAYKIWEDDGRPEGAHDDHWRRAEDHHEFVEQESEEVTKVNQEADDEFANGGGGTEGANDIKPLSTVTPD